MRKNMRPRAFTLIEMLVVVAILLLLVAIIAPSISRSIELTQRTVCQANLNSWHKALGQYSLENRGLVPGSWHQGSSVSVFWSEEALKYQNKDYYLNLGEISFEKVENYLPGFRRSVDGDPRVWQLSDAWVCPSVCSQAKIANPGIFQGHSTHHHYSYWARVNSWEPSAKPTHPQDITDMQLAPGKLIMSDMILNRDIPSYGEEFWLYNHGDGGPKAVFNDKSPRSNRGYNPKLITGVNHLYGDGHAKWITREDMRGDEGFPRRSNESPY